MIFFLCFLGFLPEHENFVYQTNDGGKIGMIRVTSRKDSLGYHITYRSDRIIEAVLDTLDLSTLQLEKIVNGRSVLRITREKGFDVYSQGNRFTYQARDSIYDRHTLDFVLRQFEYHDGFEKKIRLHIPEFMIVSAEIKVLDQEKISGPAGEILCWKIEMMPRIFLIRRKFYFWIEVNYPHRFIKYSDEPGGNYILMIDSQTGD